MNPRIAKEARALFWPWCAVLLAGLVPLARRLTSLDWPITIGNLGVFTGVCILATLAFGAEFHQRTLPLLLSQPVNRFRIWAEKMAVLAAACLSVGLIHGLVFRIGLTKAASWQDLVVGDFYLFVVVCTAAFWTLTTRSSIGGLALSAAVPFLLAGGIYLFVAKVLGVPDDEVGDRGSFLIMGGPGLVYAGLLLWLGCRKFARLEVRAVIASEGVALPESLAGWKWLSALIRCRPTGSLRNLARKELRLQNPTFLVAGVYSLCWLATSALQALQTPLSSVWNRRSVCETIFVALVSLLLPLTVILGGCVSLGEEKTLGMTASQLMLPVSAWSQWLVKLFISWLICLASGVLPPFLLWLLTIGRMGPADLLEAVKQGWGLIIAFNFVFALSFWSGSIARSTLHAVGIALVVAFVSGLTATALGLVTEPRRTFLEHPAWLWTSLIGMPAFLATLLWLSYANFRQLHEARRLWRRNLIVVAVSLISIVAAANGIYHRAWELVLPLEPRHDLPSLSQSQPIALEANAYGVAVRLPDGRVWLNPIGRGRPHRLYNLLFATSPGEKEFKWPATLNEGHFVTGSNWAEIAASWRHVVGIQSNGSLWSLCTRFSTNANDLPTQIGDENNWVHAAGWWWGGFQFLKADGSLWGWGTNSLTRTNLQTVLRAPPFRIGSDSDWAEVFQWSRSACARKQDGRVWMWTFQRNDGREEWILAPWRGLDRSQWVSISKASPGDNSSLSIGVRSDGTLWAWLATDGSNMAIAESGRIQIGRDHRWKAGWITNEGLFALDRNGTLWEWERSGGWDRTPRTLPSDLVAQTPVQMGNHSDWIAMSATDWSGMYSLAADGSVWYWHWHGSSDPLLVTPRRPEKIASIFDAVPARAK